MGKSERGKSTTYLTSNGAVIHNFKGGSAEVTVTHTLKAGQNAANVELWYESDDGKAVESIPTECDGKTVWAKVRHFSCYAVVYSLKHTQSAVEHPVGVKDNRFTDSKRIEGTLSDMLDGALAFVRSNMKVATRLDPANGARIDVPQYPMDAVREVVLNALVHRDYSFHTEGMPIQLILYSDRLEVRNPGGLYGRLTIDELGRTQPDTRNPVLVTAMESMGQTENRYSGIPRIRRSMAELSLLEPVFADSRGEFSVTLYHSKMAEKEKSIPMLLQDEKGLPEFCKTPRSRAEIIEFLAIPSAQYALRHYLDPLIEAGAIRLSLPEKPRSPKQRYETVA